MRYEYINPLTQFGYEEYTLCVYDDADTCVIRTSKSFPEGVTSAEKEAFALAMYAVHEASLTPPVPGSVSPRQIRQALTRAGLRQMVEAAVAASDQDIKDWWEFSTVFERYNPQVLMMAAALGVSEAQVDALWRLGDSL